jgi:hypothetical protein
VRGPDPERDRAPARAPPGRPQQHLFEPAASNLILRLVACASAVSGRRGAVDEVLGVVELYRGRYAGWNVRHFHSWYLRAHDGARSYSWVKNTLQAAGAVLRAAARGGKHRKRRERAPMRGMMLHQDGLTHEWVSGVRWDLIVTMDDANGEHTSMFFVDEEGSASSFHGIGQTIATSLPRETPRLCRGGSRSLTCKGVHRGNSES